MEKKGMKMCAVGILALMILSTIGSGGSGISSAQTYAPWPMFGGNAQHNWLSPYDTTQNNGELRWKLKNTSENVWYGDPPVIDSSGNIYKLSGSTLYALDSNGNIIWEYKYEGTNFYMGALAVGPEGNVYFRKEIIASSYSGIPDAHLDYILYAIKNGKALWNVTTHSRNPPVICDDGTILYEDGGLHALEPSDGSEKWFFPENGNMAPTIGNDGTIYAGLNKWSNYHYLYAIKPDGSFKWRLNISSPYYPSLSFPCPVVSWGDRIFISYKNKISTLNSEPHYLWNYIWPSVSYHTGSEQIYNNSEIKSPSVGSDGTLYVPVHYINSTYNQNGSLIKKEEFHYLYAISLDGTLRWKIRGNASFSHPAIGADGTIFVVNDGRLYAINTDGTVKWNTTDLNLNSNPVIGLEGTVYVSSPDTLYAFGKTASSDMFFALVLISVGAILIVAVAMFVMLRKEKVKKEPKP